MPIYDVDDVVLQQQDTNDKLDLIYDRLEELQSSIISGDSIVVFEFQKVNESISLLLLIVVVLLLVYVCFDR